MTDQGGDPACWLHAVCEHCGALVDDLGGHECDTREQIDERDEIDEPSGPRGQ